MLYDEAIQKCGKYSFIPTIIVYFSVLFILQAFWRIPEEDIDR